MLRAMVAVLLAVVLSACEPGVFGPVVDGITEVEIELDIEGPAESFQITGRPWGYAGDTLRFDYSVFEDDGSPAFGVVGWRVLTPRFLRILEDTGYSLEVELLSPNNRAAFMQQGPKTNNGKLKAFVRRLDTLEIGGTYIDGGNPINLYPPDSFQWSYEGPFPIVQGRKVEFCMAGFSKNGKSVYASTQRCADELGIKFDQGPFYQVNWPDGPSLLQRLAFFFNPPKREIYLARPENFLGIDVPLSVEALEQ